MALRIPHVEMPHEAPTIGPGTVIFGIGLGGAPKDLLPTAEPAEAVRIFQGVPGLMPQNAHAPLRGSPLHLEHLLQFQFRQPRMGQVERHGNPGHPIRRKPFVGHPHVGPETELAGRQFGVELLDPVGQEGPRQADSELVHREVQELLSGPRRPGWLGRLLVSCRHDRGPWWVHRYHGPTLYFTAYCMGKRRKGWSTKGMEPSQGSLF